MLTFCTLFDINYLDKGLTMYDSLKEVASDFILYVLAMDDKCYDILKDLNYPSLVPIKLEDFEDEELKKVKSSRIPGEYCWTCTPSLVLYVLNKYQPDNCAYIDADLYFYSDPKVILDEMKKHNASVQITGHRFYDDVMERRAFIAGKYCVEYNTFLNNREAKSLLQIWRNQCLDYCSADGDGIHFADQKYMDNWVDDYSFVIETSNLGAGVAPWNIAKYSLIPTKSTNLYCEGRQCNLLFYHFQNITYLTRHTVNISCFGRKGIQKELVERLYIPYLNHLEQRKQFIQDKYGIEILIVTHPGFRKSSVFKRFFSKVKFELSWLLDYKLHSKEISPRLRKKLNIIKF